MRYFNWLLRAALFLLLLGFAVKNKQSVTLSYFFGYEWHTSLVVVLLVFFAAGAAVGILAMLGNILQQRREITRLQKGVKLKSKLGDVADKLSPQTSR